MRRSLERSCCSHWRATDDRTVWCKTLHKDSAVRGQEGLGRDLGIETELTTVATWQMQVFSLVERQRKCRGMLLKNSMKQECTYCLTGYRSPGKREREKPCFLCFKAEWPKDDINRDEESWFGQQAWKVVQGAGQEKKREANNPTTDMFRIMALRLYRWFFRQKQDWVEN